MEFPTRPLANSRPPPVAEADTNGDAVYEVERVMAQRKRGRAVECLVAWKGYPAEENTWEPRRKLVRSAADALADFDAAQQGDAALGLAAATSEASDSGKGKGQKRKRAEPQPRKRWGGRAQGFAKRVQLAPLPCEGHSCAPVCGTRALGCAEEGGRCGCPESGIRPWPELCSHCKDNAEILAAHKAARLAFSPSEDDFNVSPPPAAAAKQ